MAFERCPNFRDLGGYPAEEGHRTRWGLVYRSGTLHNLTAPDMATLQGLGLRAVFDLRTHAEREGWPGPVESVHLPMSDDLAPGEIMAMLGARSVEEAEEALLGLYLGTLDRQARAFGALLGHLTDRSNLPALFHCTAGKDRTGLAAALLLLALGTDRSTVVEDYMLTARAPAADAETFGPILLAAGVPDEAVDVLLGARPRPITGALEELDRRYGNVEGYLLGPAGLDRSALRRLRELLTEPESRT